jgi:hypothetical protein
MANSQSTITLQKLVDDANSMAEIEPVLNTGTNPMNPALRAANSTMSDIYSLAFPHKWNERNLVPFVENSMQQDYALVNPDNSSVMDLSWLERGSAIDINNTASPKPFRFLEMGRQLPQQTGTWFNQGIYNPMALCSAHPNRVLYFGVWGTTTLASQASMTGTNPKAGSVYINPIGLGISMPMNPIQQIKDSNGNLLVLTGYGTEGVNPPVAPPNALPGFQVNGSTRQDASTTVWTVVDPNGFGIRVLPVPAQTGVVWQFNLVYQGKQPRFTSLDQTLDPFPDEYEEHFYRGFIAHLYSFSPKEKMQAKGEKEWQKWLMSLSGPMGLRQRQDRELEENQFTPDRGIIGGQPGRNRWLGGAWPFNYPVR